MTHNDDWLGIGSNFGNSAGSSPLGSQYARTQEAALRSLDGYRRIDAHAAVMTDEERSRRKACPGKPLTKPAGHYLTRWDEGGPCKPIEDYDLAPFKWKQKGVDMDEFRKQCEQIEKGE